MSDVVIKGVPEVVVHGVPYKSQKFILEYYVPVGSSDQTTYRLDKLPLRDLAYYAKGPLNNLLTIRLETLRSALNGGEGAFPRLEERREELQATLEFLDDLKISRELDTLLSDLQKH